MHFVLKTPLLHLPPGLCPGSTAPCASSSLLSHSLYCISLLCSVGLGRGHF
ncbi:unnamed protein product [Nyctereutes procyonoides]|uniref:(raccoon dog) hypothetical protein n=1 Tax=Nyctereutes procyonoides TaxID=34880 RepID=A0A811YFQ9_NYCPR|nr:unnamed protein product [Nyctereutes procyonoides]